MIYTPWCEHCHEMMAAMEEVASRLRDNPKLGLGVMDGEKNEVLQMRPSRYPHIVFVTRDRAHVPYIDAREAETVLAWLKTKTQHQWVEPLQPSSPWYWLKGHVDL